MILTLLLIAPNCDSCSKEAEVKITIVICDKLSSERKGVISYGLR